MPAVVDAQKCGGCGSCVDECVTEAIEVVQGKASIDADECIDCGTCVPACPDEAITQE